VEKSQKKWSLDEEDDSEDESSHPPSEVAVKIEKGVKEEGGMSVKEIALPPVKKEEIKEEADDELDPLDAYMTEVSKEVRKIKGASFRAAKGIVAATAGGKAVKGAEEKEVKNGGVNCGGSEGGEKKGLVIMMGVAKKKPELNIKKPEVRGFFFLESRDSVLIHIFTVT
jgi:hypothetical protein